MTSDKNIDPIHLIKKQNDTSAGNIVDLLPIKVEHQELTLPAPNTLSVEHPRLLIQRQQLSEFRTSLASTPDYCSFSTFLNRAVYPHLESTPMEEPQPYPPETVGKASLWRPYWRKMYMDCQVALNATRNLSIAGVILEDAELIAAAKRWTVGLADFDPAGVTSRAYNDEAAFRIIAALAWGYDWLHNYLDNDEKKRIKTALIARLEEIMNYLVDGIDLLNHPLNSHGVRSISSAVIPTSIALYHEHPTARDYLNYALEYYAKHYPPWGGSDGGWAEGPDYWNTAMAFLGESFDLIRSYTSMNLFNKAFYRNTGDFILYCMPPHSKRASFCDQSSLGDFPGLKLGYNLRHFAGVTGKNEYIWYYEELKGRDHDAESKFYNFGWWDFAYDDLRYECLWGEGRLDKEPTGAEPVTKISDKALLKVFPITGWAAFHSNMTKRDEHIHLIFKSSPFGSISHSNGDQNAFTIHAFGETLISNTGYYVGFGTDMHLKWRRQTLSKNLPLFGGQGQYAENKSSGFEAHKDRYCIEAAGKISGYDCSGTMPWVEGDATEAYRYFTPDIKRYRRKIWFIADKYFLIRDVVELASAKDMNWLVHSSFEFESSDGSEAWDIRIRGEKSQLELYFLNPLQDQSSKAGFGRPESIKRVVGFNDVDPAEYEGLEIHQRAEASFLPSTRHDILTLCIPKKISRNGGRTELSYRYMVDKELLEISIDGIDFSVDLID